MENKKLTCKTIGNLPATQRVRQQRNSKEVYLVNEVEQTVTLQLKNTEFGDLQTVARCQEGDTFSVEEGMRAAKLKMIRRLAQLTKLRIRESIANKKLDLLHLEAAERQQTRLIKRMSKKIVSLGNEPKKEVGMTELA